MSSVASPSVPFSAPYRPNRPPLRATAREFLLLVPGIRDMLRAARRQRATAGEGSRGAVMVIPALFCGDWQTSDLRAALSAEGYASFGWDLGVDWGPTPGLIAGVEARLIALAAVHGPVSLIGLSMGGLFCRWLAFRHPDRVRQVITVCSPFRMPLDSFYLPLRQAAKLWPMPGLTGMAEAIERPLAVPDTCIYSRHDGIVAWRSCMDPRFPGDCFAIDGPHVTIASDPGVRAIVLDRLGRPLDHTLDHPLGRRFGDDGPPA